MAEPIEIVAGDLDTATRTVWGEAEGESAEGKTGVAWVLRRRLETSYRGAHDLQHVCLAHAQFSCWLDGTPRRQKCLALEADSMAYQECSAVVQRVMAGQVDDPTGGANHYEVTGTDAAWAVEKGKAIPPTRVIGKHSFYNVP